MEQGGVNRLAYLNYRKDKHLDLLSKMDNESLDVLVTIINQQPRPKGAGYGSDLNLLVRRDSR